MEVSEENAKATAFKLEYRNAGNCDGIIEEYRIDNEGIAIKDTIRNYDKEFSVQIPLLVTDGMNKSEIKIDGKSFIVKYGNFSYRAECIYPENAELYICLLYTSDAADDLLCVDLGGRRIIKKKNN